MLGRSWITQRPSVTGHPLSRSRISVSRAARSARSRIYYDGISIHLGLFDNETDASDAYQKALSKIENGNFNPNDYKPKYSSKYKGVNFNKASNKWRAHITIKGSRKFLGYFKTEEEAYEAQQKVLKEYNL